jgi:hypothetical protein
MPLSWSELAVLGMLVVVGLLASGVTWPVTLAAVGIVVFLRVIVSLWEMTLRRAETAPPLTGRQRAWNAIVFVLAIGALVGVVMWCAQHQEEETRSPAPPATPPRPAEQPHDAEPRQ